MKDVIELKIHHSKCRITSSGGDMMIEVAHDKATIEKPLLGWDKPPVLIHIKGKYQTVLFAFVDMERGLDGREYPKYRNGNYPNIKVRLT